ncbi:hypothetical protein JCM15765_07880 [Paradesulfitobacterium aromaticivorans]
MILSLAAVETFIGQFHILQDINLEVPEGGVTVILGRNGAGKTTTLRTIMGLTPPSQGRINYQGEIINGLPPYAIARKGIGLIPEDQGIFTDLTVEENLRLAMRKKDGVTKFRWNMVMDFFPDLKEKLKQKSGSLSGGQKQMLAIGRALLNDNQLLLVDEPSKGLAPIVVLKAIFGPNIIAVSVPPLLAGSWDIGGIIIVKYRIFTIIIGLVVAVAGHLILTRTRIGMIVRAGVQNQEMVQVLAINIRRTFSLVFVSGAALAALGGVMMAPALGAVNPNMGLENQMLAFIVVVIGGMGSFIGSALGSVLVGLAGAYTAWVFPEASLAVNVILMAIVLLLKPNGLFGMGGGHNA